MAVHLAAALQTGLIPYSDEFSKKPFLVYFHRRDQCIRLLHVAA
ncbi:hypothetical protein [Brevibacillus massiliensis]|nr:hypothetical protein [Brevibacillus massiliensis]